MEVMGKSAKFFIFFYLQYALFIINPKYQKILTRILKSICLIYVSKNLHYFYIIFSWYKTYKLARTNSTYLNFLFSIFQ